MSKRFLEQDLLAHKGSQSGASDRHVTKHKQRDRALEIVFDPNSHKEYVTGFRKRKQQRRKEALKQLEGKQRQQRIEERAGRRQAMREQLQIDADVSDSDDDSSGGGADPEVRVFQAGTLTSTVTVAPIAVGSDSEDEKDLDGDSDDGGKPPAKSAAPNRKTAASKRPQHSSATQLSKCSLKIMAKTRMKLEGKTKGGGSWKSKSKVQDGKAEDGGRRGKRKGRR